MSTTEFMVPTCQETWFSTLLILPKNGITCVRNHIINYIYRSLPTKKSKDQVWRHVQLQNSISHKGSQIVMETNLLTLMGFSISPLDWQYSQTAGRRLERTMPTFPNTINKCLMSVFVKLTILGDSQDAAGEAPCLSGEKN